MTTSLSGDLSQSPHPAFYITDTDFRFFFFIIIFLVVGSGGGGGGGWSGRLAMVRGISCVRVHVCVRADKLLSGVHRGRFNEGPR